ncbi:MAG: Gfo/Idh/MocA family protein [Rhizomicrobium sp.]
MSSPAPPALVVGTGFGCRTQVPALRAAGFEVVGLIGTDLGRTHGYADANGVPNAFTDLDQAITQTGAVAVAVATPPHTHGALTLTAISRGCHVICEKPFAKDLAEARAMLEAAERAGVIHIIGHEFRWVPERAMLARVIADGTIGEPRLATFTSLIPYLVNPGVNIPHWWFDVEAGGGWLGAAGSHLIDWIRTVLGDFASLSGALLRLSRNDGADDGFVFRFRSLRGVEGVVQQSAADWGPPLDVVRVAGTKGTVWMEGSEIRLADRQGARAVPMADDLRLPPLPPLGADSRRETPQWRMLTQIELPSYIRLCESFRILIEGGTPPNCVPIPTFADGVAGMEVLDAIRASAADGGATVKVS